MDHTRQRNARSRSRSRSQMHGYVRTANSGKGPERRTEDTQAALQQDDLRFDLWFLEFSIKYSLDLQRPGSSHAGEQAARSNCEDGPSYYYRLKDYYYQGHADEILEVFDKKARRLQSKWMVAPEGESGIAPCPTAFPRPSTEPERASLLKCLAKIMSRIHLSSPSETRCPKRPPMKGTSHSPSPKRSRASDPTVVPRCPDILSRLDSGEVRTSTSVLESVEPLPLRDVRSSEPQEIAARPVPSVNTSMSSVLSKTFTETEDPDDSNSSFSDTQATEVTAINPSSSHLGSSFSFETPSSKPKIKTSDTAKFANRLQDIWPALPPHLHKAPLAVRWEIMRVALHCEVPMEQLSLKYHPNMNEQDSLWDRLRGLDVLKDKSFPEKSKPEAWDAAMSDHFRSTDQVVVLTAYLTMVKATSGPLFRLALQPLRLELPHRLDRRFGSDRFLELVLPSPYAKQMRKGKINESVVIDSIRHWLVEVSHFFLDRVWRSFCIREATPKKVQRDDTLNEEHDLVQQNRVYMFAEDGNDIHRMDGTFPVSPRDELTTAHTRMERDQLLEWLLQIRQSNNHGQSVCKLFSRITLGLSRTHPTVVLKPDQIRHHDYDVLSSSGKVMNDGIGRMSTALARQIRDVMQLDDIPAGYQGRFGSAKGFWIRDTDDTSDEIWIETYPSQRKWKCDYEEKDHRTFEVRDMSKELKSATLNLQLLPILEDRAIKRRDMKETVGNFMRDTLESEMNIMKEAMTDPALFKLWMYDNTASQRRQERARLGHVQWSAGLPSSREDQMGLLLDSGFDPRKLKLLSDMAFGLREDKCKELQARLNIKVGRSTYAFMVVDFSGLLEEDEVHLGFSSKFTDEQSGFRETFLHGMDVLVARLPAHYPRDIQRVKAVFRPELGSLKDVIVFSTKGDSPLADKLSGGDYDGDRAWVCWEPRIVNNFQNAPTFETPDLFTDGPLKQENTRYQSLVQSKSPTDITTRFLDDAFRFNMEPSLLGTCTKYKEKFCYSTNRIGDERAVFLSTLISHLVDRAKQGIIFSDQEWNEVRKECNGYQGDPQRAKSQMDPPEPGYRADHWDKKGEISHIIDHVKFKIGIPMVESQLKEFKQNLAEAQSFDADLVKFFQKYETFKRPNKKNIWDQVLDKLRDDTEDVIQYWKASHRDDFTIKVANTYEKWKAIQPAEDSKASKTVMSHFEEGHSMVGISPWDLLKASYFFSINHRITLPWYIAGHQLAYLKSVATSQRKHAPPILVTPEMYAGMRPDAKFGRAIAARRENQYSRQAIEMLQSVEDMSDSDD